MKTIVEKINEINNYAKKSLNIICGYDGWELNSYIPETLFRIENGVIRSKTFEGVVNKAYRIMLEDKQDKARVSP